MKDGGRASVKECERRTFYRETDMIMVLPFITGLMAIYAGIRGRRAKCIGMWCITIAVYLAWCQYHMGSQLHLNF